MSEQDKIQLFENQPIRAAWDSEQEEWYFSIVDVIKVLTGSPNPQTYWRVMKKRLKDEGNETVTNCNGLKMVAADGKRRMTENGMRPMWPQYSSYSVLYSLCHPPRRSQSKFGWPRLAGSVLRRLSTQNRPLTGLWKPISERDIPPIGYIRESLPSGSATN